MGSSRQSKTTKKSKAKKTQSKTASKSKTKSTPKKSTKTIATKSAASKTSKKSTKTTKKATATKATAAKTATKTAATKTPAKTAKATKTVTATGTEGRKLSAAAKRQQVAKIDQAREELLKRKAAKELEKHAAKTKSKSIIKDDHTPGTMGRDDLIVQYAPLIKYIAQRIAARLPANIELDDLISSGVIGLMDAIDKYDSSRDNKFKTYAEFRIRGAILDELRAQDWVPRSVREKAKQLERCYAKIEQEKGRQATDDEICDELGVSREEYYETLNQVRSVSLLSFDDISNFSRSDKKALHGNGDGSVNKISTPYNEVNQASVKRMIADAIRDLPEKQRLVLSLYYYEDLNLKEIGRVLDVTESRVSQLHTQAVLRLKGKLRTHWEEFAAIMS